VRETKRVRADVLTAHMTKDQPKPAAGKPAGVPAKASVKSGGSATDPLGDAGIIIKQIDAQGNVLVSTDTEIGRGDYGVYNADAGVATLLGNVTITRGPNAIRGQYAVMDLNNNVSRMMAAPSAPDAAPTRVEGLFVRQNQAAAPAGAGNSNVPKR